MAVEKSIQIQQLLDAFVLLFIGYTCVQQDMGSNKILLSEGECISIRHMAARVYPFLNKENQAKVDQILKNFDTQL
jgi:hypothetical protein